MWIQPSTPRPSKSKNSLATYLANIFRFSRNVTCPIWLSIYLLVYWNSVVKKAAVANARGGHFFNSVDPQGRFFIKSSNACFNLVTGPMGVTRGSQISHLFCVYANDLKRARHRNTENVLCMTMSARAFGVLNQHWFRSVKKRFRYYDQ